MLLHFNWRWVAFLHIDNDYGVDGRNVFIKLIKDTHICLAYTKGLDQNTDYTQVFKQIESQKINVIIVYAPERRAEDLIESAIDMKVTNKVWIAVETWFLNTKLSKKEGIRNIGTVLGFAEPVLPIPGFDDFISSHNYNRHEQGEFCNQYCNCSNLSPDQVLGAEVSFNFPVYAAVHAIAHALHSVLQCGAGTCNRSITVYPHMVSEKI